MKLFRRFISEIALFFLAIMLFSCNLDDFNLKKLADPTDIVPDVFAPLAYGAFKASDIPPIPVPADNFQIPAGGIELAPVFLNKIGTSFSIAAIDSVYLITHFTNDTPCEMEFELSFVNTAGIAIGMSFPSGKIPAGAVDYKIEFPLGPINQDNLQMATDIKLIFKLFPPATGNVTYGVVKPKSFTVKISFHAPVEIQNL